MRLEPLPLDGLVLVIPESFDDDRGTFFDVFRRGDFEARGMAGDFPQQSRSISRKGVVRGLHIQDPNPRAKLVSVLRGRIFDVALDVRPGSATFGRHHPVRLDAGDRRLLYLAPGFAHGFMALEDDTEVHYALGGAYDPDGQRTILWDDPDLNIPWPDVPPVLSKRDREGTPLRRYRET